VKDQKISNISVGSLLSHPLNRKVYGDEALDVGLKESVRNLGVLEPILVVKMESLDGTRGLRTYILSGHRRVLAAKKLGHRTIAARHIEIEPDDWTRAEQILLETNRQRNKSWEQKGREFIESRRIESELARGRQATSTGGKKPQLRANLPQAGTGRAHLKVTGKARDIAAEKSGTGLGSRTLDKLAQLIEAKDTEVMGAWALMDQVNVNAKSIDEAYRELKLIKDSK
jgi:hypothetical protein